MKVDWLGTLGLVICLACASWSAWMIAYVIGIVGR